MRRISKGATKRLADSVVRLTLEGATEDAKRVVSVLATFTNVQRLPGEDGQPGFGRGWGFGDPYEEFGYGKAKQKKTIPNTGDLPTSFDQEVEEDEEEESKEAAKKEKKEKPKKLDEDEHTEDHKSDTFDPDDFDMTVHAQTEDDDEEIIEDPEDSFFEPEDFDMDVVFASAVQKVSSVLGKKASHEFAGFFGGLGAASLKTAEGDDDEELVEVDVETIPEKRPRNRREVMRVWKEDLIPDVTPIIRRVLKHVSVQYSLPFSTLTNALRGQDSQVADLLADALDGISRSEE